MPTPTSPRPSLARRGIASLGASALAVAALASACASEASDDAVEATTTTTVPAATAPTTTVAPTTTEVAGLPDPCELVTLEEAEALVGAELGEGRSSDHGTAASCTYTGPPTASAAQVEIYIGDGAQQIFETDSRLATELTEVDGVGDEAWEKSKHLYVRTGSTWFVLRLVRIDNDTYSEPLQAAAQVVLDRL